MNVWHMNVCHMPACRMRDCWMAPMFKRRCCIRACSRSIFSKRKMGSSARKMERFLLRGILPGAIQQIIASTKYTQSFAAQSIWSYLHAMPVEAKLK